MEYKEIQAKSILTNCRIPGIDFVINPYIGCRFACKYCYASFMGRFVGKKVSDWGEYVYVKINAPELLKKELPKKLKNKGAGKEIFFSSVTDPYQGIEAKYKITRRCLEELHRFGFKGIISLLTKSDLVTRDINILKKLQAIVGVTITSTDDSISRYFEKYAPLSSARFKALEKLNNAGLQTYAFIGPLLPHFVAQPEELEKLFGKLKETGTRNIFIEHINLSSYIRSRLMREMKGVAKEILEKFYISQSKFYRKKLEEIIYGLVKKYEMHLMADMVIFHKEYQKKQLDRDRMDKIIENSL